MDRQDGSLRILKWDDVCPPKSKVVKIAEASFAEVYRISNEHGVSIIKVIRLASPIKAQTSTQVKNGLVDEEPRSAMDVQGELLISDWLADIPGFVMYKEHYVVKGKATKRLLDTHQAFHRRIKRQDPGRVQFYPSPSRYLNDTKFLVIELGDAGTALEDWALTDVYQLWDIFLLEAIALARAEDAILFEHRDLHEGNVCIKRTRRPKSRDNDSNTWFGYSGLEITILDYGLSRAQDPAQPAALPVAYNLENDLSLFTSTHAPQCEVYRQMRSFLLRGDREWIPPEGHTRPNPQGPKGTISWTSYMPYTNILWLAYLYRYLCHHFAGASTQLEQFKSQTSELWAHLDPCAEEGVKCFTSASELVLFALDADWIQWDQLAGVDDSITEREDSIVMSREESA
ncbi:hypothetical protein CDD82_4290 [Ophiocordyceps australis]|uniref:non-specific serine/threonine protein kinase n=1 Tax=Ophiocordyceps australis TaxID=1399860 RepID=A0A2C5Z9D2_9HYPO|nr:hypothetical protein CDD82_4290 [Ophiocordyceps australis]